MPTYGSSAKNLFTISPPNASTATNNAPTSAADLSKNRYNVIVNTETKVAQVYRQGKVGDLLPGVVGPDINIGTYNLETGKFTPDEARKSTANFGNLEAASELKHFSSAAGGRQLRDVSSKTVQKGALDSGATPQKALKISQDLTKVNPISASEANTLQQQQELVSGFNLNESLSTKEGTRTSFSNLVYPRDMSLQQDRLKIDIIEFRTRGFEGLTFAQRDQSVTTENSKGSVTLPIPGNVSDDNRVSWGSQNMNAAEAAMASAALQAIQSGGGAFEKIGSDAVKIVKENAGDIQQGFANFFAGQAAGVSGLLARTQGAVLNPNTELLFQGPALRSFSFSFKLTPRSEAEAKTVRSIIRFFKQGMAVQRTKKDLFLKAPMIFKLQFLKGSTDLHTFLPKVKLCALLGCSVNYTPEGNYATYRDSSMVSYEMALTFNELDPIFNDDYGNSQNAADTDIGF